MTKAIIIAEPSQPFIEIHREFKTTPEFLLRAFTEPDLYAQWVGPRRLTTTINEFEARNGGRWSFTSTDTDGSKYGFRGVFHGDPSINGITQTWEFDGAPGTVSLETMTFEKKDNTTVIHQRSVYPSVEARDAMTSSGMDTGVNEGNERLDELIQRMGA